MLLAFGSILRRNQGPWEVLFFNFLFVLFFKIYCFLLIRSIHFKCSVSFYVPMSPRTRIDIRNSHGPQSFLVTHPSNKCHPPPSAGIDLCFGLYRLLVLLTWDVCMLLVRLTLYLS